ncbi:hypothetical protein [Rhodohalobacter sp.]|uniref:hypothetical protein n=1 Tax=Rhodohalobacter sp. TaxID=1974210 RepID=UPI002ACE2954|nr:hypothetical protein [Rhodohalobacter sp.]MDZ7756487.1 hypothetical protein [Rhodohalobacter sp.]
MIPFQNISLPVYLLSVLFIFSFASCEERLKSFDEPGLPNHSIKIDDGIQLRAEISWDHLSQSLETEIWAENTSSDTTRIETGPCAFQILAYDSSGSDRELIWHSEMPQDWVCMDELLRFTLLPKEEKQLTGFSYISGNKWKYEIPEGEWEFEVRAKTGQDELIWIPANSVTVR